MHSNFIASLPIGWLTAVCIAFWAGLVVQDLYNEDSWIRKNIQIWRSLFVIESVIIASQNTRDEEWLEIRVKIKFTSDARKVRLVLECDQHVNVPHARKKFVLKSLDYPSIDKHREEILTVAIVSLRGKNGNPSVYSCWGDKVRKSGDTNGMLSLSRGENFLNLKISSGWKKQTESVFMVISDQNMTHQGRVWVSHTNSPYLLIEAKE